MLSPPVELTHIDADRPVEPLCQQVPEPDARLPEVALSGDGEELQGNIATQLGGDGLDLVGVVCHLHLARADAALVGEHDHLGRRNNDNAFTLYLWMFP